MNQTLPIRRALEEEADVLTDLWLSSRRAAAPAIPPPAHTDDEVRAWFRETVVPTQEVWVIGPPDAPYAMMVLDGNDVEQLYVAPDQQRQGHGERLIRFAQARRDELRLWVFEANAPARAFYEKLGFSQDGPPSSDNEEGAPALVHRWSRTRRFI